MVILIFFDSLAAAVYDQVQRNQIFEDSSRNTSWLVAQSEREFLLFENTLMNYVYGVESMDHARWLHAHGYRLGQGYHFCRPCDASVFAKFWNRALDRPVRDAADSR